MYNLRTNSLEESIYIKFNKSFEPKRNNEDEDKVTIDPFKEI